MSGTDLAGLAKPPRRGLDWRGTWLLFAQAVTVAVAVLLAFSVLGPRWGGELANMPFGGDYTMRHALERVMPSVVSIRTVADDDELSAHLGTTLVNLGSGVIVSANGYVLTNHHVVDGAGSLDVLTSTGERHVAEVVGSDAFIDIAVLRLAAVDDFVPLRFKSKGNPLQVGDMVMSVGNPYGLVNTAAFGIVSALGRTNLGLSKYEYFIQTDAAINHGSSGGALVNAHGELVGLSTALFAKQVSGNLAQGIGFAIPVELVKVAYDEIIRHGRFRRGWVGLDLSRFEKTDLRYGVLDALLVKGVTSGSPGAEAGIEPGDLVLEIDGRTPSAISYIEEATGQLLKPGRDLNLLLSREGEEFAVSLTVVER